jgi:hypothetical protein
VARIDIIESGNFGMFNGTYTKDKWISIDGVGKGGKSL